MSYAAEQVSSNKCFGGQLNKYKFKSSVLGGLQAFFNVFIPESKDDKSLYPVLYYLAGLTCNEDTGAWKGGFIRDAAAERIALVFPDTSPRGAGVEGEDADWDFGTGAGFYINASVEKFSRHYNMYSHIVDEIPQVIQTLGIPLDTKKSSIFGHSMGGHGALTLYLRNLDKYLSASAFAPITNPSNPNCQWGQKAFKGYFVNGVEEGKSYDATELIRIANSRDLHLLVDYGDADNFYKQGQLLPENFAAAARDAGFDETLVNVRCQPGYDHSYYFISTFASEHIRYHAKFLRK